MDKKIKSGKEILDEFFTALPKFEGVDKTIADKLAELYTAGKLTDANVKNELETLRTNAGKTK